MRVRHEPPGFGRSAAPAALCVAALLFRPGPAAGQEEGPIVITGREELQWLQLGDIRAWVETYFQRRIDEVESPDGETIRDTEDRLREELSLETEGFIGHPNLIELDLAVGLRFEQLWLSSDTQETDETNYEDFWGYGVSGLILKESRTPLTLYSLRRQTTIDRQFGGSLDNTLTEHGARLRIRDQTLPTLLQYFHREQDQTSLQGQTDFDLTQDTVQWQSQFSPGAGHLLTWDYTYDNIDQGGSARPNNAFERHDAIAVHTWRFGPESHQSDLRQTFLLYKETGDFPLDRIRLDESLHLRHSRSFETRYGYTFQQETRTDSRQTFQRGSAGFRHQLFESLVTNADVGLSRIELTEGDFQSDQQFASISLDYTKSVPYGRLTATGSLGYTRQENSDQGEEIQIANEPHQFSSAGRILLTRRNIILPSIVIRDVTGLLIYAENVDYTVRAVGEAVEVRRILGGAIAPQQAVLIDYLVGPEPGNTTDTTNSAITARYDFEEGILRGLGLYVRYRRQDQQRSSRGRVELIEEDIRELTYGAEYNFWKVSLLAERQDHESTASPFESARVEARYVDRFALGSAVALSADYDFLDFTDDDVTTEILTIDGRWDQRITDRLHSSVRLTWRLEDDSAGADVQAFEQQLDLTWEYRQTAIYAKVRNSILDSDANDSLFQTFIVGIRREF